jgi:hypothetical protein
VRFRVLLLVASAALIVGCGDDGNAGSSEEGDIPPNAVAVVQGAPDGQVSLDEFQGVLEQAAAGSGQKKVPDPSSSQYASLRDSAMSNLLLGRWVRGEAEERGITLSESEVNNRLGQVKKQLGGEKGYEQTLKQTKLTPEEARTQVELNLLAKQIQDQVLRGKTDMKSAATEFQTAFAEKWRSRTTCKEGFVVEQCSNGSSPPPSSEAPATGVPGG